MNKKNLNLVLIAAALALSLPSVGCKRSSTVAVINTMAPSGPVALKLKWPVGRRLVQSFGEQENGEIFMPGADAPTEQDKSTAQKYALSVLKERAVGGQEVEMKLLSFQMALKNGGNTLLDIDTTRESPSDAVAKAFRHEVGAKIHCLLDSSGSVERIEGVDDLQGRLMPGVKSDRTGTLKGLFDEDYFKRMMVMNSAQNLPENPVGPGDTWTAQLRIPLENLGSMIMDATYTLQGWEKHNNRYCARIGLEGTVKVEPGQNGQGVSVSVEEGKCSGETWFDLDVGLFVETTLNQEMKLLVTVPDKKQSQTITYVGNVSATTKLESVN